MTRRLIPFVASIALLLSTGCPKPNEEPAADTANKPEPVYTPPQNNPDPAYGSMNPENVQPQDRQPVDPAPSTTIKPADDESLTPKAAPKAGGRTYVVKKGDTLSSIAKKFYGDSSKWIKIRDANKARIKDPKKLQVGTKLVIP